MNNFSLPFYQFLLPAQVITQMIIITELESRLWLKTYLILLNKEKQKNMAISN